MLLICNILGKDQGYLRKVGILKGSLIPDYFIWIT